MTPPPVSSRGRTLALIAALLGWMFDGMEMGLFPLVGKDALRELLGTGASPETVDRWFGVTLACFLVGAATGGVLFGWLGDKIGRVRAMTVSILLYSLCSGLSAASQTPEQLAFLRFLGALGMGGEWALGVALVMELWPGASRAMMAGLIGAFGNFGYLICGGIAYGLNHTGPGQLQGWLTGVGFPTDWADALTANRNWRLLMLVGAIPALLTMVIRLFVPESEKWERAREAGKASHWSERDLIGVLIGAAAAGGVIVLWALPDLNLAVRLAGSLAGLVVVVLGYLYPARGYLLRSGLSAEGRRSTLGRMLLDRRRDRVCGRGAPRRILGPPAGLRGALHSLACLDGRLLSAQHRVRSDLRSLGGLARPDLGLLLRLAAALPSRTLPHGRSCHRPGVRLQLRPHHRRGREPPDGQPARRLRQRLLPGLRPGRGGLHRRARPDWHRARNKGKAAA
jgi:MFS family permease